ncbi:MAG: hypothetical protein K0R75_2092 [Paenibacillaceae bacterium]|nr:hypothetical protein [Paenibacillaceae bacterium]
MLWQAEKGIAIGIICPQSFVSSVTEALKLFPSFAPRIQGYQREEQAAELAEELMAEVEVLLFTGPVPYQRAKESIRFSVPAAYIPLTGSGLYRAMLLLAKSCDAQSISLDTLSRKAMEPVWNELGGKPDALFVYQSSIFPTRTELVDFHLSQFQANRSGAALTAVRSVSDELTRLGVPNAWITPTLQDIVVALERALLSTESRRHKESQIVVGFIHIDNFERLADQRGSEHEVQKMKLDVHRMLLSYVESLSGHLTHSGGGEYMFVTTRGIFERETRGYKTVPLAREADKLLGLSLSLGVGFGASANEAGTHARHALRQAKEAGGNAAFIVREDRGVIGPLEMTDPWEVDLSLIHPELLAKTEQVGMNMTYLSKLILDVSRRGRTRYSAPELATLFGVTVRTVHRLLVVWMDEGLVQIVGEERGNGKGRPKQIFDLVFISKIARESYV